MPELQDMMCHAGVVTLIKNLRGYKRNLSTASCLLIDSQNGTILTHGSLLAPLEFIERKRIFSSDDKLYIADIVKNYSANVILDVWNLKKSQGSSSDAAKGNSRRTYQTFPALLIDVIYCKSFHESLLRYMAPTNVWSFPEGFKKLLPYFVILKLTNWKPLTNPMTLCIKPSNLCEIGDTVEVYSTPFGNLSPEVFLNSVSRGIISNCFGRNQVHLLTDARCITGASGGLMCSVESDDQRYAVGILVSPFCWKERYWVGLTLACSLSEILHHLSFTKHWFNGSLSDSKETHHLKALPVSITPTSFSVLKDTNLKKDAKVSKVTRIFPNICRVISRHGNGSGIVFGADLILTCSHVIGKDTKVSVKLYKETEWRNAVVKYATPKDEPLDLAVLSLDEPSASIGTIVPLKTTQAVEGLCIYAVGYGLFSGSFDSSPSITSGTVSRVVCHGGKQILIQSSCALYPGSSGGPLVNEKGQVVSMSRSNVTMLNNNPHVSISVPMEIVMPVLQEYRKTKNVDVLKKLWLQDLDSKRLWQLKSLPESRSSLTSKL